MLVRRSSQCARAACFTLAGFGLRALAADPLLPAWPEDLGALTTAERDRAFASPGEPARSAAEPERSVEARVRRALLDLAPLPGRDVARARKELTAAATGAGADRWVAAGRYALAWVEELEGDLERARDAYRAVVLDDPRGEAARRAGTALGRLELRRDQPVDAAAWLQAVVDRGGAPGAQEYREAAVRGVLRIGENAGAPVTATRSSVTELRDATSLVTTLSGDVIVADRKRGVVVRLSRGDRPIRTWPLAGVTALAIDPFGRVFAAAAGTILRLDGDVPTVVARAGSFGALAALAVDAAGRIWIVDRRGARVGLARPDGEDPEVVREKTGERIDALAWDGRNVVAFERSATRVLAIGPDGTERMIVAGLARAPIGMSANGAGAVALLDTDGGIVIFSSAGKRIERIDTRGAGVVRATAIALGADGSVDCFDGADGRVVRLR